PSPAGGANSCGDGRRIPPPLLHPSAQSQRDAARQISTRSQRGQERHAPHGRTRLSQRQERRNERGIGMARREVEGVFEIERMGERAIGERRRSGGSRETGSENGAGAGPRPGGKLNKGFRLRR